MQKESILFYQLIILVDYGSYGLLDLLLFVLDTHHLIEEDLLFILEFLHIEITRFIG